LISTPHESKQSLGEKKKKKKKGGARLGITNGYKILYLDAAMGLGKSREKRKKKHEGGRKRENYISSTLVSQFRRTHQKKEGGKKAFAHCFGNPCEITFFPRGFVGGGGERPKEKKKEGRGAPFFCRGGLS